MNERIQQIQALLVEALNLEDFSPEEIDPDMALFGEGLELDSLDALQLAVALEEQFGVRISEEQGQAVFRSIRAIAEHLEAELGG